MIRRKNKIVKEVRWGDPTSLAMQNYGLLLYTMNHQKNTRFSDGNIYIFNCPVKQRVKTKLGEAEIGKRGFLYIVRKDFAGRV